MRKGELRKMAVAVAAELEKLTSQPWSVQAPRDPDDMPDWYVHVQRGSDPQCYVGLRQNPSYRDEEVKPDRIEIDGALPRHGNSVYPDEWARKRLNLDEPPTITVSDQKTPAQIAKDIERRLLPAWSAAYDAGLILIKEQVDRENARANRLKAYVTEFKGIAQRNSDDAFDIRLGEGCGTAEVKLSSTVKIEIDGLTDANAKKLLRFLMKYTQIKTCRACGSPIGARDYCSNPSCDYHDMGQDKKREKVTAAEIEDKDVVFVKLFDFSKPEWKFVHTAVREGDDVTLNMYYGRASGGAVETVHLNFKAGDEVVRMVDL